MMKRSLIEWYTASVEENLDNTRGTPCTEGHKNVSTNIQRVSRLRELRECLLLGSRRVQGSSCQLYFEFCCATTRIPLSIKIRGQFL